MRKYIVALLVLSGAAAAQRLKVPLIHRDHTDAERAALHEKLTRLAETRKSMGMPEVEPGSSTELDALTASAKASQPRPEHNRTGKSVKRPAQATTARAGQSQRIGQPSAATRNAWPPPSQAWTAGEPEPSLGDVARKYRAQKKRAPSSDQQ